MQRIAIYFRYGIVDSLRVRYMTRTVLSDSRLLELVTKSCIVNGIMYLGSILVYNYIICAIFQLQEATTPESSFYLQIVAYVISFAHFAWCLGIYLVSMVLSTFWVQDIFDHQIAKMRKRNPTLYTDWKPMASYEVLADVISRTLIVVVFIVSTKLVMASTMWPLNYLCELLTQSLLTAFYCFEYKTAAAGVDTYKGMLIFEKYWVYWFGFGFPFAATQFYFKAIGSSVFFCLFPFLVLVSLDEEGVGWQLHPLKERCAPAVLPIFSTVLQMKEYLVAKLL